MKATKGSTEPSPALARRQGLGIPIPYPSLHLLFDSASACTCPAHVRVGGFGFGAAKDAGRAHGPTDDIAEYAAGDVGRGGGHAHFHGVGDGEAHRTQLCPQLFEALGLVVVMVVVVVVSVVLAVVVGIRLLLFLLPRNMHRPGSGSSRDDGTASPMRPRPSLAGAPPRRGKDALEVAPRRFEGTPGRTSAERSKVPQVDVVLLDAHIHIHIAVHAIVVAHLLGREGGGSLPPAVAVARAAGGRRAVVVGNDGGGVGRAFGCVGDDDGGHDEAAEFFGRAEDGSFGAVMVVVCEG